jgi:hypothetical protein
MDKENILAEIRRTAKENGGVPIGKDRFAKITGIRPYDWGKYWVRFSEAQREAGFEPNKFKIDPLSDDFLIGALVGLIRELNHFPIAAEMRMKKLQDPTFPTDTVFRRFGLKNAMIARVYEYCLEKPEYKDVVKILEPEYKPVLSNDKTTSTVEAKSGYVYLVRGHPGEYKIGRTNLVDRRLSELGATSSIEQELIWEIKTDDPAGIEAYWHRRFQDKRMKGEWFRLNVNDVKAFKLWRRIY